MNWNTTKIEKEVIEGNTVTTQFEYLGDKSIRNIDPNCGCTSYNWDGNTLKVLIETDLVSHKLPKQLYKTQKEYYKNVFIDVNYEDNTTEQLKVNLIVKEIKGRNENNS